MSETCSPVEKGCGGTEAAAGAVEQGGDPACWANRVCPECGRLNDAERPVVCQVCGATFV